jgi:hypothetical protein
MTLELPRWALADRLALLLGVVAGIALELALSRYPAAPAGGGIVAGLGVVSWQLLLQRRRPRAVELAAPECTLRFGDGRRVPCRVGPGTRVLGATVVLHWVSPGCSESLWLTPVDLPRDVLRTVAVWLVARGSAARCGIRAHRVDG